MTDFKMPSLGADMEDGILVEWRKKPGDSVRRGDIIADVETQKGIIEIEIFDEGVIEELLIEEGAKVPVGTVMARINPNRKTASPEKAETPAKADVMEEAGKPHPIVEKSPEAPVSKKPDKRIKATPLARKMAEENGIELTSITGTGEFGAITKRDIENAIGLQPEESTEMRPAPVETAEKEISEKETAVQEAPKPLSLKEESTIKPPKPGDQSSMRMAVAAAMSKSNREIPHYYLESKVDMSKAVAWLKSTNSQRPPKQRLFPAALYIRAVAKALDEHPELNAVWEDGLQLKNEINIGFVVSLRTGGLIVPAIQDADAKSLDEIMDALNDLIPRARSLKLRSSELSASTITITNLGEGGAEKVFGVIYPSQVAILGFGDILEQPFAENGMLDVRPILTVTLAGDHRATDGLTGSRFLRALKNHLQNPETL